MSWYSMTRPMPRPVLKPAAAYLRVSSKAQTLDMQRHAITQAAATRGDQITTWYAEKLSAKTIDRPALHQLRADARAGRFSRLYVYRLDRLARSGVRDTLQVVDELRTANVDLVTLADGFDLRGPAAEIVLAVMAWAAQMERLAINERIAAARVRIEDEGGHWGRPRRLTRQEEARVRKLADDGRSHRAIAVALKIPKSTVGRLLLPQKPTPSSYPSKPAPKRLRAPRLPK